MPNAPAMVGVVTAGAQLEGAQRDTDDDFTDGPTAAEEVRASFSAILCKSELQRKFFNKHEGVHLISFDTSAPAGWGGFDEILEELAAVCAMT